MAWISFGALPCRKRSLMTARVSILLKSRASLTCFRACFLPGRAKDLSASRYLHMQWIYMWLRNLFSGAECFHGDMTLANATQTTNHKQPMTLTLILLTWRIWWAPNNSSKWQMGFNSAFKGLKTYNPTHSIYYRSKGANYTASMHGSLRKSFLRPSLLTRNV